MFNHTTYVDAKPDWETSYNPELVGAYLHELTKDFKFEKHIQLKPGAIIPLPQPTLHGFLRWVAENKKEAV